MGPHFERIYDEVLKLTLGNKPVNKGQCIAGRGNTISQQPPSTFCLEDLSDNSDDIAIYAPNPFKEANFLQKNATSSIIESEYLFLVDGGEDNQNIPLVPLLQKERELDVSNRIWLKMTTTIWCH
ncbi:AVN_HP_G0038680.mRNA.1.CDS.1 [Saccharomyces cerevisiae]|nr:AVN_HP_G0038680.mRNA.1.CDS.1 [Saccharomyces cerevisiae]CAI6876487.1 AVN_HP_G0038680.mRNA.1.CDS.1 [Saccharomyces cerevisiae]